MYELAFDFNTDEQDNQFRTEIMQNLSRYERDIKQYKEILNEYGTHDQIEREIVEDLYQQLGILREFVEQRLVPVAEQSEREIDVVRILRAEFVPVREETDRKLSTLAEILEKQAQNTDRVAAAQYRNMVFIFLTVVITCIGVLCIAAYVVVYSIV